MIELNTGGMRVLRIIMSPDADKPTKRKVWIIGPFHTDRFYLLYFILSSYQQIIYIIILY